MIKLLGYKEQEVKRKDFPFYVIAGYSLCQLFGKAIFSAKKVLIIVALFFVYFSFSSCHFNSVIDTNQSIADNKWVYTNTAKAEFEVTDTLKAHQVNFKLRINTEYRYANLYVLATFKDVKSRKKIRYQFKLAKADGTWLGKGSGDLYTYTFPLLKSHRFTSKGKYQIEIEQNMRDNPLIGVSDVGIEVK